MLVVSNRPLARFYRLELSIVQRSYSATRWSNFDGSGCW